jgi:hypothetical protein
VETSLCAKGDHVAEIDANAHRDALFVGQVLVMSHHRLAQGGGGAHRLDDAAKLAQHQITGLFEDASVELRDKRNNDLGQAKLEPGEAASFIAGEQRPQAGDENSTGSPILPLRRRLQYLSSQPWRRSRLNPAANWVTAAPTRRNTDTELIGRRH